MQWLAGPAELTSAQTPMSTNTPCCVHDWRQGPVLMWLLQLSGKLVLSFVIMLGMTKTSLNLSVFLQAPAGLLYYS